MSGGFCPQCGNARGTSARHCANCGFDFWQAAGGAAQGAESTVTVPPPPTQEAPRSSRRAPLIVAAVAVAAVLVLVGFLYIRGAADRIVNNVNDALASGAAHESGSQLSLRPAIVPLNCPETVTSFVDSLRDLDSRLGVGLNFAAYSEKVGDAKVVYDRINVSAISAGCLQQVAVPAESALNEYIDAYNTWNDCITNIDCANDSITPGLQSHWADAADLIAKAVGALDE